nr:ABC transporter permease subunit [Clostridia bacterium]
MGLYVFTMYFGGGLIPTYLVVRNLGLVNKPLVIILLGAFSVYNMIIARTYFSSAIPMELQEAAAVDGCTIARLFFSIVLPLSKPILAVIALYVAVSHWNAYFNAM